MARANWRAVAGSTAAIAAPSRRCRCQSSGRVIVSDCIGMADSRIAIAAAPHAVACRGAITPRQRPRAPRPAAAATSARSARRAPAVRRGCRPRPRGRLEHHDRVRVGHRRQAVRDDQRRLALRGALQLGLDRALVGRIERRGGLVEDQDRRVLQQRARDRHALLLAAAQLQAALADQSCRSPWASLAMKLWMCAAAAAACTSALARRPAGRRRCCSPPCR